MDDELTPADGSPISPPIVPGQGPPPGAPPPPGQPPPPEPQPAAVEIAAPWVQVSSALATEISAGLIVGVSDPVARSLASEVLEWRGKNGVWIPSQPQPADLPRKEDL